MLLTLTTELDAINMMLETIGEAPISSLEVSGLADVAVAKRILAQTSREVQSVGWHFNWEKKVYFTPDVDGHIDLPANTLRADMTYEDNLQDLTLRGVRLYDLIDRTSVFTSGVYLDIVTFLDFSDLPDIARQYIAVKAARRFANKVMGDGTVHDFTMEDEADLKAKLELHEGLVGDFNILQWEPALLRNEVI